MISKMAWIVLVWGVFALIFGTPIATSIYIVLFIFGIAKKSKEDMLNDLRATKITVKSALCTVVFRGSLFFLTVTESLLVGGLYATLCMWVDYTEYKLRKELQN